MTPMMDIVKLCRPCRYYRETVGDGVEGRCGWGEQEDRADGKARYFHVSSC